MTLSLLNFFLVLHVVVAVGAVLAISLHLTFRKLHLPADFELRTHYAALFLCLLLPFIGKFAEPDFQFAPVAKVVAAKSFRDFDSSWNLSRPSEVLSISSSVAIQSASTTFGLLAIFVLVSLLGGVLRFGWELSRLLSIVRESFLIRQIGNVRIAASDRVRVPFSTKLAKSWIIVPTSFIGDAAKFRISVLHELQHHRQYDTVWIYVLFFLKSLLFLNPFVWIWGRLISEVQELACDENLVDQNKVKAREYARALIEIATTAVGRKERLVCAAGLVFLNDRPLISRRIEFMFQERKDKKMFARFAGVVLAGLLTATAVAARNLVVDRRISMSDAQRMLAHAQENTEFPIVVNDAVLTQLNRYLGTEQGRNFIRESLQRMESYQPMLDRAIAKYHMPREILAVALVESGYRNLPQQKEWGAGIWSFIQSTARVFGMRVDSVVDERLNETKETDAAMRYLSMNHLRFQDWLLGIQAYNSGEKAVQEAIDKTGSRDVWTLLRAGLSTDRDYLAKVLAAMLILKNPEFLELN